MTLAEEMVVDQGIATPEAETVNQQLETQEQETEVVDQEDSQDRNWKHMRERNEELQRTNDRLVHANESYRQPAPQEQTPIPDWANVDDEDLLTKKQTMGVAEKVAKEAVRKALQEREYQESPKLIESEHKDYSSVVTPENVERLKKTNPRLAASLADVKDPYAQGALAYSYMKSTGIYNENNTAGTRQKAIENSRKPLPVTAVKPSNALESANAYANGLTPELKKQLFQEMQAAIRRG